jgi:hypothetical protein
MDFDELMESCWSGDPERDEALNDALENITSCRLGCELFVAMASTENDERLPATIEVARRCAEVCQATSEKLMLWESYDLGEVREAVEDCKLRCAEFESEYKSYCDPFNFTMINDENLSFDLRFRWRKFWGAAVNCRLVCEEFLSVWYEGEEEPWYEEDVEP